MHTGLRCILYFSFAALLSAAPVENPKVAVNAINTFGVKLLRIAANDSSTNLCISPYSIQEALAMTYCGADGETAREMSRVLGFPQDASSCAESFQALNVSLQQSASQSEISLRVANRLFGRTGFAFRKDFLDLLKENFQAPLEELDFGKNPNAAREKINAWVAKQTEERIQNLIPAGGITELTKLVLANALYLKAAWAEEFPKSATKPLPFLVHGRQKKNVPTMSRTDSFGYLKEKGFTAVSIPCRGGSFQFLVILPDHASEGFPSFLTADLLAQCAKLPVQDVSLFLPKFKIEPPVMRLSQKLQSLGLKSAFDIPPGSANFDHMAPRKPNDYLFISEVFHKTFVALDEKGIEAAAAATAVIMEIMAAPSMRKPVEVHVDHPFYFAIQHVSSGTCLFLGLISDPR